MMNCRASGDVPACPTLPAMLEGFIASALADCPHEQLAGLDARLLRQLVAAGLDQLPLPGQGETLARWQALAAVAAHDLSLAKLYEAHTDALAILAAAGHPQPPRSIWGVWCAQGRPGSLVMRMPAAEEYVLLDGEKPWCSGAAAVTHGLLSHRDDAGRTWLLALELGQREVSIIEDDWAAVGMAATRTARLQLQGATAQVVGAPDFYLRRPGFWHGGIGIAACWHGAAAALVGQLRQALAQRADPHALARLGSAECALHTSATSLRESAARIDAFPAEDAMRHALRTRLIVEQACTRIIDDMGAALGPHPYCGQRRSARLLADLPVWLRQSHAERDLAALATSCLQEESAPCLL
ncbi:MAG TPA: acyl-CoA dehydrogenase [Herbaspirillum sp.]|uniref:acyl-CoA dehydrogenase n=1 Tax=Herbaspirillum sp. TaxID=1890675 RepID=UPI002D4A5F1E|nr:acyl-CoA dehydrogenase [Herbaspirillum sp.]HZG22619.1 acyl-CoA dehydrogenase [Herbaspirillum sp.]